MSHPAAIRGAVLRLDGAEGACRRGARREHCGHLTEPARLLREEHVGRRAVALLEQRDRQLAGVAVANVHLDPRLLLEHVDERLDELFLAARVDRERIALRVAAAARERDHCTECGKCGDELHADLRECALWML